MQVHIGTLFCVWHKALGPQGDGMHGFVSGCGNPVTIIVQRWEILNFRFIKYNITPIYTRQYSLLSTATHLVNGSPSNPWRQLHIGAWFTTLHSALCPQTLMQGSTHLCRTQLIVASHSEFTVHSGRQLGGDPKKSGKHEQDANPLLSLQIALPPHGFGMHGFLDSGAENTTCD